MNNHFQPFIIEDHSGDLRIKAYGRDEMEALANASFALIAQIVDQDTIEQIELINIVVEDADESARFIAFLNELVYLIDAKNWLPASIKRLTTCGRGGCDRIEAVLAGQPFDRNIHERKLDIKAVTYHKFSIRRAHGMVEIQFVCDL